jgi:very-short-patch-repair endonuclease
MNTSSYEQHIIQILRAEGIRFIREKTYSDLKGGKFRFDFYLPSLNILIEMDGEYHWKPIRGRAALLKQQEHDRLKNSYCLAKEIKLYRIPYWDLPNIKKYSDIIHPQYLVRSKWHNDYLIPK